MELIEQGTSTSKNIIRAPQNGTKKMRNVSDATKNLISTKFKPWIVKETTRLFQRIFGGQHFKCIKFITEHATPKFSN